MSPWHGADNLDAMTQSLLKALRAPFVLVADLALSYSPLSGSGKAREQWDSLCWLQAGVRPVCQSGKQHREGMLPWAVVCERTIMQSSLPLYGISMQVAASAAFMLQRRHTTNRLADNSLGGREDQTCRRCVGCLMLCNAPQARGSRCWPLALSSTLVATTQDKQSVTAPDAVCPTTVPRPASFHHVTQVSAYLHSQPQMPIIL